MRLLRRLWRALRRRLRPVRLDWLPDVLVPGDGAPVVVYGPFTVCDGDGTPLAVGGRLCRRWTGDVWVLDWYDGDRVHEWRDAPLTVAGDTLVVDVDGFGRRVLRPLVSDDRRLLVPQPPPHVSALGMTRQIRRSWALTS